MGGRGPFLIAASAMRFSARRPPFPSRCRSARPRRPTRRSRTSSWKAALLRPRQGPVGRPRRENANEHAGVEHAAADDGGAGRGSGWAADRLTAASPRRAPGEAVRQTDRRSACRCQQPRPRNRPAVVDLSRHGGRCVTQESPEWSAALHSRLRASGQCRTRLPVGAAGRWRGDQTGHRRRRPQESDR